MTRSLLIGTALFGAAALCYVAVTPKTRAPEPVTVLYPEPPPDPLDYYLRRGQQNTGCWLGDVFIPLATEPWMLDLPGRRVEAMRMCRPPNTVIVERCTDDRCLDREPVEATSEGTVLRTLTDQSFGVAPLLLMEVSGDGYWVVLRGWNRAERFSLIDVDAPPHQVRMDPNNPRKVYGVHGDALVVASEKGIRLEGPDHHGFWPFPEPIHVQYVGSDGENLWIIELEGRLSKLALIDGLASTVASTDLGDVGVGLAVDARGVAVLTDRVLGPPALLRLYDLELNLLTQHPFDASLFAPQVVLGPDQVAVGEGKDWEFFQRP